MTKRRLKLKTKVKSFLLFIFILTIIIADFICIKKLTPNFIVKNYKKNVVINYGDSNTKYTPSVCYGITSNCHDVNTIITGEVDYNTIGEYNLVYTYTYNEKIYTINQTIEVKDTEAPTITLKDDDIQICPNGNIIKFDIEVNDNFDKDIKDKIKTEIKDNKLLVIAEDSNGNKTEKEFNVTIEDKEAPKITINGNKNKTIILGSKYNEEGATVIDNCDNPEIKIEGTVDPNTLGTYTIKYTATDNSNNTTIEERKVNVKNKTAGSRVIYLTFDDGPGAYTGQLLDVLKKYNVKATFFVTGKGDDALIKREYDEGHKVALHTNSHNYSYIYASQENYFADLYEIRNRVKRITGYESNIIRFPGGTSNTVSKISMKELAKEVTNRGFYYFDWNVSSGDAGGTTTSDGIYNNVVSNLKSGASVVLQHDIKKFSVEAVERIIQYAFDNGYTFATLDETSPVIHHGANK